MKINFLVYFFSYYSQVDGLQDEAKLEAQSVIGTHWGEDCADLGLEGKVEVAFHLTSIYDHSIFEAFSKVVQKLIPELPTLEGLLNIFTSVSIMEKSEIELSKLSVFNCVPAEFPNGEDLSLRCTVQDLHRHRLQPGRCSAVRALQRYDRCSR